MGSHWRHRSAKTSSPVTGSFVRGGYIWELIWERHLKIWTHFGFYSCLTEVFSYNIRKTNQRKSPLCTEVTQVNIYPIGKLGWLNKNLSHSDVLLKFYFGCRCTWRLSVLGKKKTLWEARAKPRSVLKKSDDLSVLRQKDPQDEA